MHTIFRVLLISCLIKTLLPAAYPHAVMSDAHSFFGIATGSEGQAYAIFSPFSIGTEQPAVSCLFVYSKESPSDEKSRDQINRELVAFAKTIEAQQGSPLVEIFRSIQEKRPVAVTVLFARLGRQYAETIYSGEESSPRNFDFQAHKDEWDVLVSGGSIFKPVFNTEPITEICQKVQTLQDTFPYAPFHVAIDLLRWRNMIASIEGNQKLHGKYTKRLRFCSLL